MSPNVLLRPINGISRMVVFNLTFDKWISLSLPSDKASGLPFFRLSGIFQETEGVCYVQSELAHWSLNTSKCFAFRKGICPTATLGDTRGDTDSSVIDLPH